MSDKKRIDLKFPIPLPREGGGTVDAAAVYLTTRIKVKHLELFPKVDFDSKGKPKPVDLKGMLPLIASLLEIPLEAVKEMDLEDLNVVSAEVEKVMGELGGSRSTTGSE